MRKKYYAAFHYALRGKLFNNSNFYYRMKKTHRKNLNITWGIISVIAVLGMIAFTLLPLIY